MPATTIAEDVDKPPQPNGTLVFRLSDRQWYWSPHVRATCWCQFKTREDSLELYRGAYHAAVIQEGITDGDNSVNGESGQVGSAPGAFVITAEAPSPNWTDDQWIGYTATIYDYATGASQSFVISDNDENSFTITDPADPPVGWDAPAHYDFFIIHKQVNDNAGIAVHWKTLKIGLGNARKLKQFIEFALNTLASGTLEINWTVDGKGAGKLIFDLTAGDRYWGTQDDGSFNYGAYNVEPTSTTLLWQDTAESDLSMNFPDSAEGKFIEFEIELTTTEPFEIAMMALTYLIHVGNRWA